MTFNTRTVSFLATLCAAALLTFSCSIDNTPIPFENGAEEPGEVPMTACTSDPNCQAAGGRCDLARQVCSPSCETTLDCRTGEVCDSGKGYCVECVGDTDCGGGSVCRASLCGTACVTPVDCGSGRTCGESGLCIADPSGAGTGGMPGEGGAPGDGDGALGGDDDDGTGGSGDGAGGGNGDGAGGGGDTLQCRPEVKILVQRSGAMFENPSADDTWWAAISEALAGEGAPVVSSYAESLDLGVRTFHMTAGDMNCPIINDGPQAASDLAQFLADEQLAHEESGEKIDAPLPEAISSAASSYARIDNRHLILVVSGNPDSCDSQDDVCAIEPTVLALQAAHAAGITTKVLYLSSSTPYGGYEQAIANAGAGEPVAEMDGLGTSCGTDPTYYSEAGGDAPYEAPNSTGEVRASLEALLDSIGSCQ